MTTTCKNCNQVFNGNFCNNCGQTAATHDINFKSTAHDIQHVLLHVDKGILYTTKELFRRPGHTINGYINGHRVQHFKPFGYILILSTIYALLTKASDKTNLFDDFLRGVNNGSKGKSSTADFSLFQETLQWMSSHYAYATLIILPLGSLASYLCFIKAKQNYFKHLVLNSYVAGMQTAVFLLLIPFVYFVKDETTNDVIYTFKFYFGVCLMIWTYYQFFNTIKPLKRILFILLTLVVMLVLFMVLFVGIALISMLLK